MALFPASAILKVSKMWFSIKELNSKTIILLNLAGYLLILVSGGPRDFAGYLLLKYTNRSQYSWLKSFYFGMSFNNQYIPIH